MIFIATLTEYKMLEYYRYIIWFLIKLYFRVFFLDWGGGGLCDSMLETSLDLSRSLSLSLIENTENKVTTFLYK